MRKLLFLAFMIVSIMVTASEVYVETAVATGNTLGEAKESAVKKALLRIARYVSTEVAESTLREVRYSNEGMKESYFKRVETRTDVVIEGYDVEVLSQRKRNGYYEVKVRVSVSKETVEKSLKRMSILTLAEILYSNGYIEGAMNILGKSKSEFSSPLWQKKFSKLYINIMNEKKILEEKLDRAQMDKNSGKILTYIRSVAEILKRWKDYPKSKVLIDDVKNTVKNLEIVVGDFPKELIVLRKKSFEINVKYNGKSIADQASIDVITPDNTDSVVFNGATTTASVSPQYLYKDYAVKLSLYGFLEKSLSFKTRILDKREDIKGCIVRTTFPSFTDLPVGKKTKMAIIAPPKTWFYLFDYDDSKKTLKLLLKRRMTNKGSFVLSFYFDQPTRDFYEGAVVVFSKDPIPNLYEGSIYELKSLRETLNKIDTLTTREIVYRVEEK